jgi:flagellar capping protein FliD
MGTVNFTGAGTGINWNLIIENEIATRTSHHITPLQNWKDTWENKISAFDDLRTRLTALRTAVEDMDTPDELRSYAAQSSSDSTVSAAISGNADPGTHSIEVNQLASAELEVHDGVADDSTVVNNSGSSRYFAYSYDGESVTLAVDDGTTLEELAALINNDSNNPGVTASVLDDGSGGATSHHLVLQGKDTGASHTITVDPVGTTLAGDWGALTADALSGTSSLAVDDASAFHQYQAILVADDDTAAEYQIVDSIAAGTLTLRGTLTGDFTVAQNAYATPRGIGSGLTEAVSSGVTQITVSDGNHFVVGQTVIIADASGYEEAVISAVDSDTVTVSAALTNGYAADGYVTQLEGGRRFTFEDTDFSEVQPARNAQVRFDGYPAGSWIERETNVLSDVIPGVTLTLHAATTPGSPVTIAVNTDADGVKEKISAFVDAYNAVKTFLNDRTSYNPDTKKAGVFLGNYAAELVESILREAVSNPPPGFVDGTDPYTLLGQIGLGTVGRTDDESALGTIEIDQTKLDEALADDFEGVIRLLSADFAGYSDSDYITFYQASGTLATPGIYNVEADFTGGVLTAARMKLSTESAFRSATVDAPYITGAAGNPEYGLWVRAAWDGSSTTQTATVRLTRGVAGRLASSLDDLLDNTDGLLHNIEESYKGITEQIDDRIQQEQDRLDLLKERLTLKYAKLEQLLVELQGQQSWAGDLASSMSTK